MILFDNAYAESVEALRAGSLLRKSRTLPQREKTSVWAIPKCSATSKLSRRPRVLPDAFKTTLIEILGEIRADTFAQEWKAEREAGYPVFKRLKAEALAHEINRVEKRLQEITRTA